MSNPISDHNKDITFKILAQEYKDKSFDALGVKLPKIEKFLSTQLPHIMASEMRCDNVFLLEDGRVLIVDYESTVKTSDIMKYLGYTYFVLKYLFNEDSKLRKVVLLIIYTGKTKKTSSHFDLGSVQINIEQVFLSKFNTDLLYTELKNKIELCGALSDEDITKLIYLPLTETRDENIQGVIRSTVELAKSIKDERQQLFAISAILVVTDKFIKIIRPRLRSGFR